MSKNIPTKINNYNVYNEGEKLLGVGDELTLPDFEQLVYDFNNPVFEFH